MIMKIQAGGPAFPYVLVNNSSETMNTFGIELAPGKTANFSGMTMRDYFAAKAMASIVRRWDGHSFGGGPESPQYKELAEDAYYIADAMLRAREAS